MLMTMSSNKCLINAGVGFSNDCSVWGGGGCQRVWLTACYDSSLPIVKYDKRLTRRTTLFVQPKNLHSTFFVVQLVRI